MSHVQSPPRGGAGEARSGAPWLRLAGVGLLAPALAALALAAAPAAAQAATTGIITGSFAVPSGTTSPSDVSVQLVDRNGVPVTTGVGHETVTPTTTTTATYTINNVAPGQYYVYFSDTGNGDNVAPDYYGDGGVDNITKATVLTVPATAGTQSLTAVTLTAGATITGTVIDANSAVESSSRVTAEPTASAYDADPMLAAVTATVTGGSYKISGLPADTYTLRYGATGSGFRLSGLYVDGSGLSYDYGSATQYAVTGTTTTTANFSVPAVGGLSGTVTDTSGAALDGVNVVVFDAAGNQIPSTATTAADGTYTISDVLPGSYEVEFDGLAGSNLASTFYGGVTLATATKVTVSSGATTASVNATLAAGATVSGTVTAAQGGAPLGGLPVEVLDAQGNVVAGATTNPNGSYTLTDVPAGTWYLEFVGGHAYNGQYYATEYYLGQGTLGGARALKLTAGEALTGVNQALLAESPTLPGLPKVSLGRLSGLATNKVALSFRLTAGAGTAGYLQSFSIKLPKYVSWNKAALKKDIVIARDKYTYAIKAGRLVITFTSGKKLVNFRIKAGGIKVGKGIMAQAKARKIKSEGIALAVTDTTGKASAASFTVKKPH
jgi:hypothetical protein